MRKDVEPKSLSTRVELAKAGAIGGIKGGYVEFSRQRAEKIKETNPKDSEWNREMYVLKKLEYKKIAGKAAVSATLAMAKRWEELSEQSAKNIVPASMLLAAA